ncbi:conjugal transfer protein TraW [Eilatimonas milleporae]|uniref:Conjugal transfer pilus assembly protein TraW n=1 Tax=Eilatimonas milleporae TaxID=911205 RepID=A0A3M0C8M4_9PROT|nr:conjugal transfer protein TraW [Eilatimonas milleporae]RMB05047.1 conjugal transfer pilus assembly protein TraW [Eilatimonas milleporae]
MTGRHIGVAVLCLALLSAGKADERMIIGQVYPISEPDALAEIEQRVADHTFDPGVFGPEESWSALRSPVLPVAEAHDRRSVVPLFTLSFDIPDGNGNILYPKGYTFNPLDYLPRLQQRLIIVNEMQLGWALAEAGAYDMILLSGGNALAASRDHKTHIYKLEDRVRTRLEVRAVPSIVWQEDAHFIVEEILLEEGLDG